MEKLRHLIGWLGGDLLDFVRIGTLRLVVPYSRLKFRIINSVRKRTGATVFIESGTQFGLTAGWCASVFKRVYTIELDKRLARQATLNLVGKKNVQVIEGDAVKILPKLFQSGNVSDSLVYLDGHYSGEGTACGELPEPAIEELEILSKFREKIRGVIVDDFRCFGTEPGFPRKSELLKCAEDCFAGYGFEIFVQLDQLIITPSR